MLTTSILKNPFRHFVLLTTIAFASFGCGDTQQVDSKEIATDLNKPKNDIAKEQDERFLVSAAEFDFEQILLGKLAKQRATSADVKELARMLEEAHRTSKTELGSMGIVKSIAIPSTPTKTAHAAYDKVNNVSVEDFDAAFLSQVIASHNNAISLFEQCIGGNHDADIRNWAISKLPDLRLHLAKTMDLEAQSGPLSEVIR